MERRPVRDPKGWDDMPPRGDINADEATGRNDKKLDKSIGWSIEQG